jgi:hypothetical protein
MKRSDFNLQTIVLASAVLSTAVLSTAVLFGVIFTPHGYYTQMADAQRSSGDTTSDATTKTLATQ